MRPTSRAARCGLLRARRYSPMNRDARPPRLSIPEATSSAKRSDISVCRGEGHPDCAIEGLRPLPSKGRLPVAGWSEQQNYSRVGLVEHLDQPRSLDDAALAANRVRLFRACGHACLPSFRDVTLSAVNATPLAKNFKGAGASAAEGYAADAASPSAPVVGSRRLQAMRQRVFTRQQPESDRDLPPPWYAQLLPEDVAVCFRRAGRDAELETHLVVRQTLGDQFHDLALPVGNP